MGPDEFTSKTQIKSYKSGALHFLFEVDSYKTEMDSAGVYQAYYYAIPGSVVAVNGKETIPVKEAALRYEASDCSDPEFLDLLLYKGSVSI